MSFGISHIPTLEVVALRCGLAFFAMGLLFYKRLKHHMSRSLLLYASLAGFFLFAVFACLILGIAHTDASTRGSSKV